MPSHSPIQIHIRVALYVWFCDHSGWWVVWVCDSGLGGGFDLWGGQVDFHIRVCISPEGLGMFVAPPTVRSL